MRKILCAVLFLALALSAAELTGKWSGSAEFASDDGQTRTAEAYMDLKQAGAEVTGTVGPNAGDQTALQKGKLDGKKLTFEVVLNNGSTIKFDLVFDGETIQGNATGVRDSGEKMLIKLNLKRAT